MLLCVDVGNTNLVFGVLRADSDEVLSHFRLATRRDNTADDWQAALLPLLGRAGILPDAILGVAISSVVPVITRALTDMSRRAFGCEPVNITIDSNLGLTIDVDSPGEMGPDRLVNCAAAYEIYGGPTIVVDVGTATKIEAIQPNGTYIGGAIAPGIGLTMDALASKAARLYAVELTFPPVTIGRNTIDAVQAGVVTGHLAMIEGLVARTAREMGCEPRHVVLCGGYTPIFAGHSSLFTDVRPDLTLVGLRRLYARNHRP